MRALLCLVVLLVSCVPSTPRTTAEGYLGALARLDFEGAAGFVAEERRADFRDLRQLYSSLPEAEREKFRITDWKIESETVAGTTAVVDFSFDGDRRGELALTLVSGQWRVDHRAY